MTELGLLDTSVFIAAGAGCPLEASRLPDEAAISVVTLAELQAGVLVAPDTETRARRLVTVDAPANVELIPIDAEAALTWSRMRVLRVEAGMRVDVNDLWIAASAASRDLSVVTQDDDFTAVEGMAGLVVIRL